MGAPVIKTYPYTLCGYKFEGKRARSLRQACTPRPYSKINSLGEEIILTYEERCDWVEAFHQALEDLGQPLRGHNREEVYHKVEEILKEKGSYRFL